MSDVCVHLPPRPPKHNHPTNAANPPPPPPLPSFPATTHTHSIMREAQPSYKSAVRYKFVDDRRDHPLLPTNGSYFSVSNYTYIHLCHHIYTHIYICVCVCVCVCVRIDEWMDERKGGMDVFNPLTPATPAPPPTTTTRRPNTRKPPIPTTQPHPISGAGRSGRPPLR
jgi:hypothetical protein